MNDSPFSSVLGLSVAVCVGWGGCSKSGGSCPAAETPDAAKVRRTQVTTTSTHTSPPKPTHPKHQAGTALVREIETWDKAAVVGEASGEHSLGGMGITVDDAPVWPPEGAGCEQLIRCCNDRVAAKSEAALPCLLSVTKNKSCAQALATVNAVGIEQQQKQPPSCDAPPS